MSGSKATPGGTAARTRLLYAAASARDLTGGFRLGITTARPNTRAVKGTTDVRETPSRRWRCLGGRASHEQGEKLDTFGALSELQERQCTHQSSG